MNTVDVANQTIPSLAAAAQSDSLEPRHWRVAIAFGVAGMIAIMLLLPYLLSMMPDIANQVRIPLPVFAIAQVVQGGIMVTVLSWIGLRLGYRHGLDAPRLRQWLRAGASAIPPSRWALACAIGSAVAVVAIVVSLISPLTANAAHAGTPAWWQGLLASAYGGIAEETLCRLFLMSLLVWIFARAFSEGNAKAGIYWSAIVFAALLFGAGHLPALAQIHAFTVTNAIQVVALNAICGIAYGWLFWRRGLEHAIVAHFSSDIVLHVLAPLTSSI